MEPSPKPVPPELHEDVLKHIATFVKANEGTKGLRSFRLVSKLWNLAGTQLLPKHLALTSPKRSLPEFVNFMKSATEAEISRHSFKSIEVYYRETDAMNQIRLFLLPDQPWTASLTSLSLEAFNVSEYNKMMEKILSSFPQLQTLSLKVTKEANRLKLSKELDPRPRPKTDLLDSSKIRNENLKHLSLALGNFLADRNQITAFDWNFLQACPNFQELKLDSLEPPHFSRVAHELNRLQPKLKLLDIFEQRGQFHIQDVSNTVNNFKLTTLMYSIEYKLLPGFLNNISCGAIETLKLRLLDVDQKRHRKPEKDTDNHDFLKLLFSTVIHDRFSSLRVLHIDISMERDIRLSANLHAIPVMKTLQEFKLTSPPNLGGKIWQIMCSIFTKISTCFPNLRFFDGEVEGSKETKLLLISLAKLQKLWKLNIRKKGVHGQTSAYFRNKSQNYLGLAGISMLTSLGLTLPQESATHQDFIDSIAQELPKLKQLRLRIGPIRLSNELRDYATDKLRKESNVNVKFLKYDDSDD